MNTTVTRERPILFSAPMVRAILGGRKTQTRRIIKPQPTFEHVMDFVGPDGAKPLATCDQPTICDGARISTVYCPYGYTGDRLWVRETWLTYLGMITRRTEREGADTWPMVAGEPCAYDADEDGQLLELGWVRRPSIFMPRRFSRITLEVTEIRAERLQTITEEDAVREGFGPVVVPYQIPPAITTECYVGHLPLFIRLWDELNGKSHPWESNPWVWVVSFRRITP